jgi:hypothetical protein
MMPDGAGLNIGCKQIAGMRFYEWLFRLQSFYFYISLKPVGYRTFR